MPCDHPAEASVGGHSLRPIGLGGSGMGESGAAERTRTAAIFLPPAPQGSTITQPLHTPSARHYQPRRHLDIMYRLELKPRAV